MTAVVAFASGILDGVSMVGLTIRTLVIIMMLAAAPAGGGPVRRHGLHGGDDDLRRLVGVRGAAEPDHESESVSSPRQRLLPDVLRAGRHRRLLVVAWELRGKLRGQRVNLDNMDVIDANAADVRFLQAARHGEVLTEVELIEPTPVHREAWREPVIARIRRGEALGLAMIEEDVPEPTRRLLLGHFVAEELADGLDRHYVLDAAGRVRGGVPGGAGRR